jgi:CHASE2 domain-containing sensor protein
VPAIGRSAAAVGHVNVLAEAEGVARQLLIRASDDQGPWFRAMALETVRVADGVPAQSVTDSEKAIVAGDRVIPVEGARPPVVLGHTNAPPETLVAARMTIDYIGPAGSFSPMTYSVADVIDESAPVSSFRKKYVLIGATAASLGDRFASPFLHDGGSAGPDGSFMPGVEVLANALNSILRARFYSQAPPAVGIAWTAALAALTLARQGRRAKHGSVEPRRLRCRRALPRRRAPRPRADR